MKTVQKKMATNRNLHEMTIVLSNLHFLATQKQTPTLFVCFAGMDPPTPPQNSAHLSSTGPKWRSVSTFSIPTQI